MSPRPRPPHWRTYSATKPRVDNYLNFDQFHTAAGVPRKTARHWIDRQQVDFDADIVRGEVVEQGIFKGHVPHRRFTEFDCIRAALIDRLTELGFETEDASHGIEKAIRQICSEHDLRYYPPAERETAEIIDALTGAAFVIRLGQRVQDAHTRRMERMREIMIFDESRLKKIHPDNQGTLIILFTAEIVRDVYKRLNTMQERD